jgi:hypothetical protein
MMARLLALCLGTGCLIAGAVVAIPPVVRGTPARCPARPQPVHAATCGATGAVAAGFLLLFVALACFAVAVVAKQEMGQAAEARRREQKHEAGASNEDNE